MTTTELIALVTAVASGLYTLWQGMASDLQARDLERLRSALAAEQQRSQAALTDANAEAQARREYEFEARKRLYRDVQPLLFQLRDPLQTASEHVLNLARAARDGRLSGGAQPWLKDPYYLGATLYRLLAPAAYYELMRERLSLSDFSLDARAAAIYRLLDQYVRALRADFRLAPAFYGPDVYQPVDGGSSADGSDRRQGLLAGTRDVMVQAMLADDPAAAAMGGAPRRRVLRFGEFQNALSEHPAPFQPFVSILDGFAPAAAPTLCALLMVLAGLAEMTRRALGREAPSLVDVAQSLAADDAFWAARCFGPSGSELAAKVRRVAVADLLSCAAHAADVDA